MTVTEEELRRVEQALLTAWEFIEASTSWQGHDSWAPDDRLEALLAVNDGLDAIGRPPRTSSPLKPEKK